MWLLRTNSSWAPIFPRIILALTFIPAGWSKLTDFQSKALSWQLNFGFEYWQTGVAVFVEFFGGLAILLGLLTRPAAFGVIVVMLVGIWVAHLDSGFYPTYDTYGYNLKYYPFLYGSLHEYTTNFQQTSRLENNYFVKLFIHKN